MLSPTPTVGIDLPLIITISFSGKVFFRTEATEIPAVPPPTTHIFLIGFISFTISFEKVD